MHRNEANSLVLIDENLITTPVGLQQGTADHFEKTHHAAVQLQQKACSKGTTAKSLKETACHHGASGSVAVAAANPGNMAS